MFLDIFYWVFNMSITATVAGLIVMLIRCIKKLPRRFAVLLWLAPFFRMCIPIGLNSPYSIMTLLSRLSTKTVTVYKLGKSIPITSTNAIGFAKTYFPITFEENILENVFLVGSVVWTSVSVVLLISFAWSYFITLWQMKNAEHHLKNVFYSEIVTSPAVYGVFRPKIVLPYSMKNSDTKLVLLHEMTHIERKDNLWRLLALGITAVHWFNPFAWIFLKIFLNDLELACDERSISKLDDDERKAYARSLLLAVKPSKAFVSAFGGARIKTRIENILSFKEITLFSGIMFFGIVIVIFALLLTNAGK